MDLRGTRAAPSEIREYAVQGYSEDALDALVTTYMESEEFYRRIEVLATDIFLTRDDDIVFFTDSFNFMNEDVRSDVIRAIGDEPPKFLQHLVRNNRPLTELVTADYTIANSTLADFWHLPYKGPEGGDEWLVSRYDDEREAAGILGQTSFYYRYSSTFTNKNRHRANQLARIFLGDDHFMRNISIDLRQGDEMVDLDDAPRTNPSCIACHATLDGLGAHFYGFSIGPDGSLPYARERFSYFSGDGKQRNLIRLGRKRTFYGYPSDGLEDLGRYIANDPRFARAMVGHIFRFYVHQKLDYRDRELITELAEDLVASDYDTKALIRQIVKTDVYRAVGVSATSKERNKEARKRPASGNVITPLNQWEEARRSLQKLKWDPGTTLRWRRLLHFHEEKALESWALESEMPPSSTRKGTGYVVGFREEMIEPFKLATPEQLHSLGLALTGQAWNAEEGGTDLLPGMDNLLYNSDIKVAAGGYDGYLVLERSDAIPASYLMVLERWATVLARDAVEEEILQAAPLDERKVFTLVQGTEIPSASETVIRQQLADWLERFYGLPPETDHVLVDAAYSILQTAHTEAQEIYPDRNSIAIAWQQTLAMMLSDVQIAAY